MNLSDNSDSRTRKQMEINANIIHIRGTKSENLFNKFQLKYDELKRTSTKLILCCDGKPFIELKIKRKKRKKIIETSRSPTFRLDVFIDFDSSIFADSTLFRNCEMIFFFLFGFMFSLTNQMTTLCCRFIHFGRIKAARLI